MKPTARSVSPALPEAVDPEAVEHEVDHDHSSIKNGQPPQSWQNHSHEESTLSLHRSTDPSLESYSPIHEQTSVCREGASPPELSSKSEDEVSPVYAPLPDPSSYIRLLRIQSVEATSSDTSHVRCVLHLFPLEQAPPYNAISYTWGPPTPTKSIYVDGKLREIRKNCKDVLLQAYNWQPSEYYWIDAICIDQNNLEEKGPQVAMMGDLFGKAKHVLACVGNHADDSELLYATLERSELLFHKMGSFKNWKYVPPGTCALAFVLWAVCKKEKIVLQVYDALKAFRARPYFTRLWVYQELFLAQNVTVFCGKSYLPIRLFLGMSFGPLTLGMSIRRIGVKRWIINLRDRSTLVERLNSPLMDIQSPFFFAGSFIRKRLTLVKVLKDVEGLSCQDPRDMIYGIRSLLTGKPRYRSSRITCEIGSIWLLKF